MYFILAFLRLVNAISTPMLTFIVVTHLNWVTMAWRMKPEGLSEKIPTFNLVDWLSRIENKELHQTTETTSLQYFQQGLQTK